MPTVPPLLESPESASPLVTRAVAAGLKDAYPESNFRDWQQAVLKFAGLFPQKLVSYAISRAQALTSLDPALLAGLKIYQLAAARVGDFDSMDRTFPCVTVGAALGGAAAHLSLALGGPFLPQAFVLTLKGGSPDGDVRTYFQRSAELARQIAHQNPEVMTIQHYDPVHDGWVTRWANHLRLKLLGLPGPYADFLRQRLQPGGAVCYLACGAQWLRYRTGERSIFQVGGWGGIAPEEFIQGSLRLKRYCEAAGFKDCGWSLPDCPLEVGPESEWGSEPGLGEALQAFCEREGYRFVPIALPGPHDFSRLAFKAVEHLLQEAGRQPAGVLIEMFSQFDATAVLRSGLLPLWLVFNTTDSLAFLQEMLPEIPPERPVFFSPVVTFSFTPDMAPWPAWEETLRELNWRNIGARPERYPADTGALVNWYTPLRRWVAEHENPIHSRLDPEALQILASRITNESNPYPR